ncbi:Transportin-3-like [Oopsacas minuta]|uniref:Transportin-3-like n=1 Tax=Oopsacas minuta TaxID=111878 RepID=A0AAV7KBM8_9METZ|nr:Transportin-3-like [Oopsacas minuta]
MDVTCAIQGSCNPAIEEPPNNPAGRKCAKLFFSLPYLQNIIPLSVAAAKIGHREASLSILKFYKDLVTTAFPGAKMIDAQSDALTALNTNGQTIIDVLVFGLAGEIPSRLSIELADCLWAFLESCRNETLQWIRSSLERAPDHSPSGLAVRADTKQKFYSDTEKCEDKEHFKSICRSLAGKYHA